MRKLNKELMVKEPVKDSDKDVVNYSNMNEKLDTIISLMSNMLSELKKLNTYNDDKIKSRSLFTPFG